ncbi:hypothetical protein GGI07_005143 [Coemansia sp. Benny D115]|nr:hypothetical protein GGI07_005143 [Coemansia sp. Benny D115]
MGYEPPGIFSKSRKTGHHGLQKRTDTGNTDVSVNQAYRSWSYISCTWFANWQVAAPKELNLTSYRSQLLTADLWEQTECATAFGSSVALPVDVARHNSKWLDILKSVSRIYYTAGEFDPWRGATLGAEDKDKEIMGTGGGNGTDTVVYVMSGATHTQEMYLTDQNDLVSVKAARQLGDQLIMKWTLGSAGTE